MSTTKEDRSFKTLINRETTDSVNKFFFNELGADTINVHTDDIWVDSIPFDDPATAVLLGVVEQRTLQVLTEDPTVPNQQSWKAVDPSGDINNPRLRDWISTKYGDSFQVRLFDGNDDEIFITDSVDWFFSEQTGVLTFNGDPSIFPQPFKITGYRYIGAKGVSSSRTQEDFTISVDPGSGMDPDHLFTVETQAQADAWGSFATIAAAVGVLPSSIRNLVEIRIADGDWTLTDWGDWQRLNIDFSKGGRIRVRSESLFNELTGDLQVDSFSGRTLTLDSDPGFDEDQYVNKLLRIKSGTGASEDTNLVWVRAHNGTSWTTGSWDTPPDGTSVVRVVEPATNIDTSGADIRISGAYDVPFSESMVFGENGAPVEFVGLNITGSLDRFQLVGISCSFPYTSFQNQRLDIVECSAFLNGLLVDDGFFSVDGSFVKTRSTGDQVWEAGGLVGRRLNLGVSIDGSVQNRLSSSVDVSGESLDDSSYGYIIFGGTSGPHIRHRGDFDSIGGLGRVFYFFKSQGAVLKLDAESTYPSGSTADVELRNGQYTYADIDAEANDSITDFAANTVFLIDASNSKSLVDTRKTQEDFTISVDPSSGADPDWPLVIVTQAQADAWGDFATIEGAVNALPSRISHAVIIEHADGGFTVDSNNRQPFGDFGRISIDEPGHESNDPCYLRIKSKSLYSVLETDLDVDSATSNTVTISGDSGFTADEHQDQFLRVVSGTGAGQVAAIVGHTGGVGDQFTIAGSWTDIPDDSSVVEVVTPAVVVTMNAITGNFHGNGQYYYATADHGLIVEGFTFTGPTFMQVFGANMTFGHCKFEGMYLSANHYAIVHLYRGPLVFTGGAVGVFVVGNSRVQIGSFTGENSVLVRDAADFAAFESRNSRVMVINAHIADCKAITQSEEGAYVSMNGDRVQSSGVLEYISLLVKNSSTEVSNTGSFPSSSVADLQIDGTDVSFADLDSAGDSIEGVKGSIVLLG